MVPPGVIRPPPPGDATAANYSHHILVDFHSWGKVIPFQGREFFLHFWQLF